MSKRLNNIIMRRKSETAYNSAGSKDASSVPDAMDMARNGHPNDSWFKVADSGGSTSEDHREMTRPISKGHLPNGQGNINASDPNRSLNPATSSLPDIGSQDFETKPVAECVKSGSLSGMIQPEEMGQGAFHRFFLKKGPHKGKDGISPDISPPQFTVPIHSEPNKSKAIWEGDVKEQALQKAAPPIPVSRDMELLKKRSHDHRVRDTEKAIIAKTGDKGADRLHPLSGLFLQASHVRRLAAKIWDQLISWVTFDRHTFRERTDITALSTPQYMDGVIQVEGGPLNTIDIRGPAATILRYFKTARIRNVLTFSIILLALSFLLPRPEAWSQALGDHKRVQYTGAAADHFASQSIAPLALGGDSGNRMSATEHVIALAVSPERPSLTMQAILGRTENVEEMLRRVGVQNNEAELLFSKIANIFDEGSDKTGTKFEILLGRRPEAKKPRPVEHVKFRAAFDRAVTIGKLDDDWFVKDEAIRVDDTPLRITGTVGGSLYRSARSAGAPTKVIQEFLQILGEKISLRRDVRASDIFDFVANYRRAETGEVEIGAVRYVALSRKGKPLVALASWEQDGKALWYDKDGKNTSGESFATPTHGRITSKYGMRRHPLLRYKRMHSGVDYGGGYGAPIYAVADGNIDFAGRKGGYGKYVRIRHKNGLGSGYAHMSRIKVRAGTKVKRGQVIGYIGSTGLSTGPHLHYELYRNGKAIDPASVKKYEVKSLRGLQLRRFRDAWVKNADVEPGLALRPFPQTAQQLANNANDEKPVSFAIPSHIGINLPSHAR